jgi:hypothetical protein
VKSRQQVRTFARNHFQKFLSTLAIGLLLTGCAGESGQTGDSSGRVSVYYNGPAELSYCSNVRTFSSSVTITGTAVYQKREIVLPNSSGENGGLGSASSDIPIRRAEVRVTNSSGTEVQCGETDNSGNFSLSLPTGTSSYKIWINSRADNSYVKVSVLNRPEKNNVYSLSTNVTPVSSKSVGTLRATVDSAILGAAFFMFDMILTSNEYLVSELSSCSTQVDQCSDFTVAPKSVIYWEPGFNPNYYNGVSSGVSFYVPDYSRLFILGGVDGNTNRSDTDHFDPSIIIHEYGHFLEDIYSAKDSPGGTHTGNSQIDPRLALSEGWGQFIQAAVLDDPFMMDTIGNIDGCTLSNISDCTDFYLYIPIEEPDASCGTASGCDIPDVADEGNFREFAITRFFWDLIDTNNDGETVTGGFPELWASLTSSTVGLNRSAYKFRDIGLLTLIQDTMLTQGSGSSPITNWSSARTLNDIRADRREYSYYVEGDSTTCSSVRNFSMTPYDDPDDDGGFSAPNWLRNNDFFHYYHAGGALTLTLNYISASGTCNDDLDIYIYDEDARFGNTADILGKADTSPNAVNSSVQTEVITSTSLAAGNYLINVKLFLTDSKCGVNRISGGNVNYEIISSTGGRLCPKTLP